ncbi:MAG: aminotransferase class V-fold PLP-dependent enzyme [Bacteroidales bacterium]|nr:aminotransferase class V-fold PLP-dependent enzyme [Bacteroidales bacterium]
MLTAESRLRDFPTLAHMTYFNTAAEGLPPQSVGQALQQYYQDKLQGMDGRTAHFAEWEKTKALVGQFYGLSPEEVSICSCSSEAYNLAAMALRLQPGDEVIINDLDFPSGITPWLQSGSHATAKVWHHREGSLATEDLLTLLTSRTRLVTVSLVSFYNGCYLNLQEVADTVRRYSDALLAVDVTQALGRVPLDLRQADLIVSSTHKWILASHGGGLVGVPQARAEAWTAPAGGWFNLRDAFGPDRFTRAESLQGAASFTVGMPNFPAVYAIRAGLEYIQSVGVEAIEKAARPRTEQVWNALRQMPVELLSPKNVERIAGIVAFRHPDAERIQAALRNAGIHVMSHAGRIRIAVHGYNTDADVEHLLSTLSTALQAG